ncbi:hypothetical protein [Ruegeria lacuscaerulensis]|uniref:hypothetical protein n=1 Tax=Ruegeria lacuscaerulensis TaxID=55218 RepID=UPI0014806176|nr:hypothetical protein [Ruegeria lacuscaerulensis]
MKYAAIFAAVAISACATVAAAKDPIPASSDNFEIYSEVEGWTVYADNDSGTCLIEKVFESGNVMQMGLTKNQKHGYLGVFTQADIDIKNRQKIEIAIDDFVYEGRAKGIKSKKLADDYSGGYIVVKDANMATAVAEGQTLIAFPKKSANFVVDLTGTKKAMEEGRKCNLALAS